MVTLILISLSEQSTRRSAVNVQYQAGGTHVSSPFGGLKMCHVFLFFQLLTITKLQPAIISCG